MIQTQQPKDKLDLVEKVKRYQQMSNKLSQTIKDMLFINEESKLKVWSEELMKLAND